MEETYNNMVLQRILLRKLKSVVGQPEQLSTKKGEITFIKYFLNHKDEDV